MANNQTSTPQGKSKTEIGRQLDAMSGLMTTAIDSMIQQRQTQQGVYPPPPQPPQAPQVPNPQPAPHPEKKEGFGWGSLILAGLAGFVVGQVLQVEVEEPQPKKHFWE